MGSDGLVYSFDPTYYATKVKTIYARVKDSAGNIHGLAVSGKSEVDQILSDRIVQDLNTVEGTEMIKALGQETTRRTSDRYSQTFSDMPATNGGKTAVNTANTMTIGT